MELLEPEACVAKEFASEGFVVPWPDPLTAS